MTLDALIAALPDYAKDLRLNLSSLLAEDILTDQRKYGLLVACAHATGYRPLIVAAEAEASAKLDAAAMTAAKTAAAIMAMNNVYYRFVHLASNKEYGKLPAKLRMNAISRPGIDKSDFELMSLAVSAINGCGLCIDSHEQVLRQHGVSIEVIQTAARLAAVVNAVAKTHQAIAGN
ncbi:alkyl hydroperoxide reductase [Hankyongella ginsenosidimutans]|uniref:Alkyl hydroperoxide reductase AhpD n=1 Tax=Hankyongella ginsenosidimutans TaxID=1763828 RepID=A0A4D7C8L0_9SPHN|nr:carboxymuconolactone decarboxylase family protein [Hankyongella ginsenosidimutans]QCI79123.1 alkyl hydroperoxide reductase [Hankyongella ginsenosidimutans]TXG84928.1 MAG: alkyl hydroperoxide reductase [Sphingomonadales bacterium]